MKESDVTKCIQENWYMDDQFIRQFGDGSPQKEVVLERWRVYDAAIQEYLSGKIFSRAFRILDAGCGDGLNLVGLEKIFSNLGQVVELHGIDLSHLRVDRVVQRLKNVKTLVASVDALPYEDSYFDMVLCNHVLEHLQSPNIALKELRRVTRQGGIIFIGVPNEGCFFARLRNYIFQRNILKTTDHINFFTGESLNEIMTISSIKPHMICRRGFFLPHMRLRVLFNSPIGLGILKWLSVLFPSQAADLIAVSIRET